MFFKVSTFACFVALSAALPIVFKPSSAFYKRSSTDEGQKSWQTVRFFHSPTKNLMHQEPNYLYPHYEFEYAVSDNKHGDHKRHYEHRNGDKVHGEYSLVEPGGLLRRVEYNADDENGFNAVVYHHVNRHGDHGHSCIENTGYYHQSKPKTKEHNPKIIPEQEHKEKPVVEKSEETSETNNSIANQKENETEKEIKENEPLPEKKEKVSFSSLMIVGPPIKPPNPREKDMENDQKHGDEKITLENEQKTSENSMSTKTRTMPILIGDNLKEDSKDTAVASSHYRPEYYRTSYYYDS